MRILVASKFYYNRGGAEIVARQCVEALQAAGHEVGVLAMDHPQNSDLPAAAFLAPEVSFRTPFAMALRTLGLGSVRRTVRKALEEFRPDVVHLHNVHSYLSPVIVKMAKEAGCRTVWTLHDYKLICPAYTCLRGREICERCLTSPAAVLKERCMKGPAAVSAMAYAEARRWSIRNLIRWTDVFVCPSRFMADKMQMAGIPEEKLRVVCNFVGDEMLHHNDLPSKGDYYAYFGRLAPEKGIETLLETAISLPNRLKIFGKGPLEEELRRKYGGYGQIEFRGHADTATVAAEMAGSRLTVMPSEWYENNPLSIMESLCLGTPVVGSNMGGIPELISDGMNGRLFAARDRQQLREAIEQTYNSTHFDYDSIRRESRKRFSAEMHIKELESIYRGKGKEI